MTLVRGLPESFVLEDIKENAIDSAIIAAAGGGGGDGDELGGMATDFLNPDKQVRKESFVSLALATLYHVGIIGVKPTATSPFSWIYREGRNIGAGDINQDCHFRIHKMFWREFGVAPQPYSYDPS